MTKEITEDILNKIKGCLALASDKSNENECQTAALMAQKLMAKYNVEITDLDYENGDNDKINVESYYMPEGRTWKFDLAYVIASNFRCKSFGYGKKTVAFYGAGDDPKIAMEVYKYVYNYGHKLACKEVNKQYREMGIMAGVYNSYVIGFMKGLKLKLDEQCKALMLVISEKVKTEFKDFMAKAKPMNTTVKSSQHNREAFSKGFSEGQRVMGTRELN